ncbi:DUF7555 family protein [Halorarius litoreus]|uniref:DUF7555 family protein n=1 Tax=Halorarius litoreus TaxID=2962676 RepID=UPI0020CD4DC3|nr:hypothetical protein [Halorarius litoreus]
MATSRPPRWALRALDGLQYGLALTLTAGVVTAALTYLVALVSRGPDALALVNPLLAVQLVLFFGGFAAMAFGALKLRPEAPYKENARFGLSLPDSGSAEGGFSEQVADLPPLGWYDPADSERLSGGGRLLVASALMLLVSYLVEAVAFQLL